MRRNDDDWNGLAGESSEIAEPYRAPAKVGRNERCPCGSEEIQEVLRPVTPARRAIPRNVHAGRWREPRLFRLEAPRHDEGNLREIPVTAAAAMKVLIRVSTPAQRGFEKNSPYRKTTTQWNHQSHGMVHPIQDHVVSTSVRGAAIDEELVAIWRDIVGVIPKTSLHRKSREGRAWTGREQRLRLRRRLPSSEISRRNGVELQIAPDEEQLPAIARPHDKITASRGDRDRGTRR